MSESDQPESPQGPFLLRSTGMSMLHLSVGSACTIATLLCIPDGAAILPDTASFGTWLMRVIGLWLSAYVLWTLGFLAILHLMRWLSRGIELRSDGLKLWRFGKLVKWESVQALTCEPQPVFSKLFCLSPVVYRLTLYCVPEGRFALKTKSLSCHTIPSFQLSPKDFQSLLIYVTKRCFNIELSSAHVLIADASCKPQLKHSLIQGQKTRVLVSAFILVSLVVFLARRAVVYYNFNKANKAFRQERYVAALADYRIAVGFDSTFAPGWDRLARTEYRLNRIGDAENDWQKAMLMKPDFVEAKIGLATIALRRHEYPQARHLLKNAVRLSPTNVAAQLSLADLYIREYQYTSAIDMLNQLVGNSECNGRARALLARAYLRSGQLSEAKHQLAKTASHKLDGASDAAFASLVGAELSIADGHLMNAEMALKRLSDPFKNGEVPDDLLLNWIALRTAQADAVAVETLVRAAQRRGIPKDEIETASRELVRGTAAYE